MKDDDVTDLDYSYLPYNIHHKKWIERSRFWANQVVEINYDTPFTAGEVFFLIIRTVLFIAYFFFLLFMYRSFSRPDSMVPEFIFGMAAVIAIWRGFFFFPHYVKKFLTKKK